MSKVRRPDGKPAALLQARVEPRITAAVTAAAKASGVSTSYYVELLMTQLLTANDGALPPVRAPRPQQEALFDDVAA